MPIFSTPTVWMALMSAFNSVGVATAITATLNFIAVTAASMAASKLLSPKAPSFSDASLLDRNQTIRSPIAARQIIYGQCKTSGVLAPSQAFDASALLEAAGLEVMIADPA